MPQGLTFDKGLSIGQKIEILLRIELIDDHRHGAIGIQSMPREQIDHEDALVLVCIQELG